MNKKPNPEEIIRHKELIRYYQTQIYKLTSQQNYLTKQLARIKAQLKDYQKEKKKLEKRLAKK
jgi:septal ring factor EnvC (AmiA/AmiB activator)